VAGTSSTGPSRAFRIILIVHGVVTLAAAVVLVAFPAAIPATVGIDIGVEVFLLPYFLAAAELAVGILSIGAVRLTDTAAIRLIALVFVVFHLTTAALEITYLVLTGPQPALAGNVVVRLLAGALFWFLARAPRGE